MNLSDVENKVGAQLESLEAVVPEPIGRFVAAPVEALKKLVPEKDAVIRPGLAMTAATLGAVALGGWLHDRSGLAGFDAIVSGLPGFRRRGGLPGFRQRRLFRRGVSARRVAVAVGMIVGGSFALAGLQAALGNRIPKNAAARGAAAATAAFALDRLFLGRSYLRAIQRALGWTGTALTYASIGTACALMAPRRQPAKPDPTGGDISAGVPAM